ncbi:uncharacterized protein LOC106171798 [Lingula anatina]|uniref:Uncharacterized protein LOC106171798 n=1 Tax=Lingula anatina TaxID=7574 RepID=A0A1S3JBD6_LINAN|nr:uncharacterized protein LOC106171798 [Lingula anatina]|eukprot:XP_013407720.1 uncharacterized protein LOC106171798 [Lingula anatina]
MSGIKFHKYKALGSDFLIVDNRQNTFACNEDVIKTMCERHTGIGAQGLIAIQSHPSWDFEMSFYNIQGKPGSLCAMAMMCAIQYAIDIKLSLKAEIYFKSRHGIHSAKSYAEEHAIRIKFHDLDTITKLDELNYYVDIGVPHHIQFKPNVYSLDLHKESLDSQGYRYYGDLISFVHCDEDRKIHVRTYNRRLELETMSCGTSAVAAAIALAFKKKKFKTREKPNKKVKRVVNRGGEMAVTYDQTGDLEFTDISVVGRAQTVFQGNYICGLDEYVII